MMVRMISKRSQAHVEFVVSFVIFVGFLLFIFFLLNPFSQRQTTISILDEVYDNVIKEISDEVGRLSIILKEDGACYFYPGNNYTEIRNVENPRKFDLYFSDLIDDSNPNNDPLCDSGNFSIGVYFKEDLIFYEKIAGLVNNYENDYESLKSSINVLDDFSFEVFSISKIKIDELSVSKKIPVGINVDSKELIVRTINSDGEFQNLILRIRAW